MAALSDHNSPSSLLPVEDSQNNAKLLEFLVKKGFGAKGVADSGVGVPSRYILPPHKRIGGQETSIIDGSSYLGPPIDMSGLEGERREEVEEAIRVAAAKLGAFHVINHGMSAEALENVSRGAHAFFDQPAEKKAAYLKSVTPCPNVYYGTSVQPEREDKTMEWRDYLTMVYKNDQEAMDFWPIQCREAAMEYLKSSTRIVKVILDILLRGVEEDDSKKKTYLESPIVTMNYYPPCPNPDIAVGLDKHTDIGTLTVMLQSDAGGLYVQVQSEGEEKYIAVPLVEGGLIIIVGDAMEILSNGRYKSSLHFAVPDPNTSRLSVPIFFRPPLGNTIGPLPGFVEKDGKAVYKSILFQECLAKKIATRDKGKRTALIAKIED